MKDGRNITLAIESAVAGGSLAVLSGDEVLASWSGPSDVSRAEDLLVNIDDLLERTGIDKHDIDLIAVSAGPGSFTGIRIGIATALGLKAGLGVPMASVSALVAMVLGEGLIAKVTAALPVGRNAVCVQEFENGAATGEPATIREDEFAARVTSSGERFLVHPILAERVEPSQNIVIPGQPLAVAIGRYCSAHPDSFTEPLFISKSF